MPGPSWGPIFSCVFQWALTLKLGYADAMLCGMEGRFNTHLRHLLDIIGRAPGVSRCATVSALMLEAGTFFICDTHVIPNPTTEQIAEIAILCAEEVQQFGIHPRVALLSYSNFGTSGLDSPVKMRKARKLIRELSPGLEVEGEMHADGALSEEIRSSLFPNSLLEGQANLLVMPSLDAANITFNMFKVLGAGRQMRSDYGRPVRTSPCTDTHHICAGSIEYDRCGQCQCGSYATNS